MESFHLDAGRDVKILVRRTGFPDEKTQVYEVIPSPNSWGRSCEDNSHASYSRLTYEIDLCPLHFFFCLFYDMSTQNKPCYPALEC